MPSPVKVSLRRFLTYYVPKDIVTIIVPYDLTPDELAWLGTLLAADLDREGLVKPSADGYVLTKKGREQW